MGVHPVVACGTAPGRKGLFPHWPWTRSGLGPLPTRESRSYNAYGPVRRDCSPMSAVAVSSEPLDVEWDAFVDAAPGGHHLQTSLWAQVKAKHGWRAKRFTVRRDGTIVVGCQLLVRRLPLGSIAYCPRGPLSVDSDAALVDRLISELAAIARRERILYVKVQPPVGRTDIEPLLLACGFVRSDLPATPTATVRI